jgi:hypothetical protein
MIDKLAHIDRWAIVGAKALNYLGFSRYTKDTDILCHTSVVKDMITIFQENNFKPIRLNESQVKMIKGNEEYDLLITSAEEYSEAMIRDKNGFTSPSGLLDMYLLSGKEQNQFDAINLLKIYKGRLGPSDLVIELERDKWTHVREASLKPIETFKPRELADDFNLEELLAEFK